jgi:plastocyanin
MHTPSLPTLALALILLAPPAAAQQAAPPAIDPKWMTVEARAQRVSFEIVAGHTPFNGGLNFNGFRDGELTFVVPAGWTVTMGFVNQDRNLPHSVQIIPDSQPLPLRAVDPVIPGAATQDAEMGTTSGSPKERFRFTAEHPGSYIVFCAVAGHGLGGMWARLKVDSTVTAPAILLTPKPATR